MPEPPVRLSITLLVDDPEAWILPYAARLRDRLARDHDVRLVHQARDVPPGDLAFLLGCVGLVGPEVLARNTMTLVVHESDLPRGRGFSPVAWQVLAGCREIPVVLFEARPEADAGPIHLRDGIILEGNELWPEIRRLQGEKTMELVHRFVAGWPPAAPVAQTGPATRYRRRTRADDRLDPARPLAELFDQLRVADNDRYPAWFALRGRCFVLKIEPMDPSAPPEEDTPC